VASGVSARTDHGAGRKTDVRPGSGARFNYDCSGQIAGPTPFADRPTLPAVSTGERNTYLSLRSWSDADEKTVSPCRIYRGAER
jgi:hypothetical protein